MSANDSGSGGRTTPGRARGTETGSGDRDGLGGPRGGAERRDSSLYLADDLPDGPAHAPGLEHPAHVAIQLYVEDADATYGRAIAAGARAVSPPCDMYLGDRCGTVADPFGHLWTISTHVRHVVLDDEREAVRELHEPSSPPA